MEINILDRAVVEQIIFEINSFQNKERKENEWDSYQIKDGLLREYVVSELRKLFPKNFRKMRISDINVTKKVINKIAKSYSVPPQRMVQEASPEITSDIQDLYAKNKFNAAFRSFDTVFNLSKYALYWVNYDSEAQKYRPQTLKPYEYDLVRDSNTGEILCVILSYPDIDVTTKNLNAGVPLEVSDGINQLISESKFDAGAQSKVYALWTNENHVVVVATKKTMKTATGTDVNYAITYVPIDGNPSNINPIGVLPFVYKQKDDCTDYPVANPLAMQTKNFNILFSDMLTTATMQGFGQAVLKYPDNSELKEIEVGYMNAIKLPQSTLPDSPQTDFNFVNANPNLEGQQKAYITYLSEVLGEHGIVANQTKDGDAQQFASGLDRMIASSDVQWLIKENQECYQELENDVFKIVKLWEQSLGNNAYNDYEELKVIFEKPTINLSDTEKLNNIKMKLELGLMDREMALKEINPNLSDDDAKLLIEKIDAPQKEMMQLALNEEPVNQVEENQDQNIDG